MGACSPVICIAELIRKVGIGEQNFYRWKKQYGSLQPDQAREFTQLKQENAPE